MITQEEIIQRANELQKQAEKLRADLSAVMGAIQDCGYWLDKLEKLKAAQQTHKES